MHEVDFRRVFEAIPHITGLPFIRRGDRWCAACRISGEPHGRWDKTIATMYNNKVWLSEQGGASVSIVDWLLSYGGIGSLRDAFSVLHENARSNIRIPPPTPEPKMRYVWGAVLDREKYKIGVIKDGLYVALSRYFDEDVVSEYYHRYNVTPQVSEYGVETIFWYVDQMDRVCFDKRIVYDKSGHRSKKRGGGRLFTKSRGYRGRCMFGVQSAQNIVESEKTALYCAMHFGGDWMATGGANMTSLISDEHILYPDRDAYDLWDGKFPGQCVKWWDEWGYADCGEKDDPADYIEWILTKKQKYECKNRGGQDSAVN